MGLFAFLKQVPEYTITAKIANIRRDIISFIFSFLLFQQSSTLTRISAAQVELSATQAQQSAVLAQLSATQAQQSAMLAKNEMVVESISKDVTGFIYAIGGFTVLCAGGASVLRY